MSRLHPARLKMPGLGVALLATLLALPLAAAPADPREMRHGHEIPSEGYVDQPYVVVRADGAWVCTLTTGPGHEGEDKQHVVATISHDQGRTWSPLIDIEPHGPPESSWVMPLIVPSGRIYAFYVYNAENMREVIASTEYARHRVDTLGHYVFRYSDDGGETWSAERHRVPIRTFEIDRRNPYQGEVQFFWGVGKPHVHEDAVYIGIAKIERFGETFIEKSEGVFLRSANILHEPDPEQLEWETLPEGDIGLRAPRGPIAEEHNLTSLSDGSLFCTWRTIDGHPCHAYSRDGGRTWTPPAYMTESPDGRVFKHPRAANFVRRFNNGKYLWWFHNHAGTDFMGRNPVWICGGEERDGYIHWSQPEILLWDADPTTRMSYPDFIEQDGRIFVTETQKTVARVHAVAPELLAGVWDFDAAQQTEEGLLLESAPGAEAVALAELPRLEPGAGFSLEFRAPGTAGVLLDARDAAGRGVLLRVTEEMTLVLEAGDGEQDVHLSTEPLDFAAEGLNHVVVIFDGGPGVVLFVLNGQLLDGGAVHPQGWLRLPAGMQDLNGTSEAELGGAAHFRLYGRALRTAEAVANYRYLKQESGA